MQVPQPIEIADDGWWWWRRLVSAEKVSHNRTKFMTNHFAMQRIKTR
jgi:hypothetical protein